MEVEVTGANQIERAKSVKDRVRVKRKTLEAVLEQCQRALEMVSNAGGCVDDDDDKDSDDDADSDGVDERCEGSLAPCDRETDEVIGFCEFDFVFNFCFLVF